MLDRITSGYELSKRFSEYGRGDQFSPSGYDKLLEFYDEIDEDYELDVIEICCEWSEYDEENDIIADYGNLIDEDEFTDDEGYFDRGEYLYALMSELRANTTVLDLDSYGVLIQAF